MGEIEAVGRPIGGQVIPAALAAQLPAVNDLVRLLRGEQRWGGKQAAQQGGGKES